MSKALVVFVFSIVLAASSVAQDVLPERYHTYQEVLDTLTQLRDSFPEILYLDTLGFSNRDSLPMLRLKISDNPQIDEDEPAVFLCGGVHADEVLGVEVVVNFIQDFVSKYADGDPDVIEFTQEMELFCIPFINPEGHTAVEGGILDWRKNKSDNDTNGVFDIHDGVDNNRNYDFGWSIDNSGSANSPESLEFKGFYPFSESENRAMADFAWKYRPLIAIDYHSPTYGRPNVAYYPWYWYPNQGGSGFGPDETLMQSICQSFTSRIEAIPDDSATGTYTARRALVDKGDFKTYFYGNLGTAAFSCEISDTTIQNPALVDTIVAAHLPGQYYLLRRALQGGITGIIRDSVTLEPLEAEVQVLEHINDDINPRLSRPDYGRYRRLLGSGSYTLRFLKDGYRTKTINNVVVSSNQPTETDVLLYPFNPRPPAPELTFPGPGDSLDVDTFMFDWSEPIYAANYLLEVAADSMFETLLIVDSSLAESQYDVADPLDNGHYFWRVRAGNANGWGPYSEKADFFVAVPVGIDSHNSLPSGFQLFQSYPNPFNATTRIAFEIPTASRVELEIFDLSGASVCKPAEGWYPAGHYDLIWNGTGESGEAVASGVYFYRLKAGAGSEVKRMILLK